MTDNEIADFAADGWDCEIEAHFNDLVDVSIEDDYPDEVIDEAIRIYELMFNAQVDRESPIAALFSVAVSASRAHAISQISTMTGFSRRAVENACGTWRYETELPRLGAEGFINRLRTSEDTIARLDDEEASHAPQ